MLYLGIRLVARAGPEKMGRRQKLPKENGVCQKRYDKDDEKKLVAFDEFHTLNIPQQKNPPKGIFLSVSGLVHAVRTFWMGNNCLAGQIPKF